jgi:hypothetical protein
MFAADRERNLWVSITKDPDVTLMLEQDDLNRHLDIVRIETYDTIRAAIARMKSITKMSRARRRRLVEKTNPDWKHIGYGPRVAVTPTAAQSDRDEGDSSGGVPARIFVPVGPGSGANAKLRPYE